MSHARWLVEFPVSQQTTSHCVLPAFGLTPQDPSNVCLLQRRFHKDGSRPAVVVSPMAKAPSPSGSPGPLSILSSHGDDYEQELVHPMEIDEDHADGSDAVVISQSIELAHPSEGQQPEAEEAVNAPEQCTDYLQPHSRKLRKTDDRVVWYLSTGACTIAAPNRLTPGTEVARGTLYIHRIEASARTLSATQIWLYCPGHDDLDYWRPILDANHVMHPVLANLYLSFRKDGEPNWVVESTLRRKSPWLRIYRV
ncbi:hypothetical protein B0H21DRAFT_759655 [Amylocystis lapponica]|nr:hypothetical protein B0H21DRAFT_759655 [Amylocystis lapponica]